jgi:hypothetical protein
MLQGMSGVGRRSVDAGEGRKVSLDALVMLPALLQVEYLLTCPFV